MTDNGVSVSNEEKPSTDLVSEHNEDPVRQLALVFAISLVAFPVVPQAANTGIRWVIIPVAPLVANSGALDPHYAGLRYLFKYS